MENAHTPATSAVPPPLIHPHNSWTPSLEPRSVIVDVGGQRIVLTRQQHALFSAMTRAPGKIFTKRELIEVLGTQAKSKILDVQLCRISNLLRLAFPDPANPPPVQINAHWGLGHSMTFGPPTAPTSDIRWTPGRKQEFFDTLLSLEHAASAHTTSESIRLAQTLSDENLNRLSEKQELALRRLAAHRSRYPEITDRMINEWRAYGVKAVYDV